MKQEVEDFMMRRNKWLNNATDVIQRNNCLLSRPQAREVAKMALESWEDLRFCLEWVESSDFLLTLK